MRVAACAPERPPLSIEQTSASVGTANAEFLRTRYVVTVQTVLLMAALASLAAPVWWGAITRERGYSLVVFGTLNTVNAAVAFVVGTWLAIVVQRLDRRLVMVGCGLAMASAELLTVVAVDPIALYAVRGLNAAALGIATVLGMVFLGYTRDPSKSYGWYTTLQALSQAVGLFSIPVLARVLGFKGLQIALMLPGLAIAALSLRLPRSAPQAVLEPGQAAAVVPKIFWAAALPAIGAFLAFGFYTNDFFGYSERFGNARGLDPERIGLILSITTAAGIPASLFVSWLGSRIGTLWPVTIGAAFGAGASLLLVQPDLGEAGYWVAMVVFSLVWSFVLPYLLALFATVDPVGRLFIATQPIRAAVSTVLLAGLTAAIARNGLAAVAWLAMLAICLCPLLVAAALHMHGRRERRSRKADAAAAAAAL